MFLIDYGLARVTGGALYHEKHDHALVPWMAPEVVACRPCRPACDVHSLACLLGQVLARSTVLGPDGGGGTAAP